MSKKSAAPRLILHVGPQKTGTSALQHILRSHDGSAVAYPKVGQWGDGAHHNLVFNFYGFRRPEVQSMDLAAGVAEIGALSRSSDRPLVVSSEALFGLGAQPLLEALLDATGLTRAQAQILVVHREAYARAASFYNQRVKDGFVGERRSPGDYLREAAASLVYSPTLRALAATGVAVKLLSYEPAADFVPRALDHLGFPSEPRPQVEARNVSLSVLGLAATLAVNRVSTDAETRALLNGALRKLRGFWAPSRFLFDLDSVRAVEPMFRSDLAEMEAEWGFRGATLDLAEVKNEFTLGGDQIEQIAVVCAALPRELRETYLNCVAEIASRPAAV